MPKIFRLQAAPRLYTILAWLCFAELMVLFAFLYASFIRIAFFQFDEFEFVKKGFFYELFFLRHDATDPQWMIFENDPAQPKVGPYIYGAALTAAGYRDITAYFTRYDTFKKGMGVNWYEWLGKEPDQLPEEVRSTLPLVFVGRWVSLGFTLAMLGVVFWLSRLIGGYLYGLVTLALLGFNPLLLAHGIYAMTDTFLLFFFSAGLFTALVLLRSLKRQELPSQSRTYALSALFGFLCAMSAGVKVTGILLFVFGFLGLMILMFLPRAVVQEKKRLIVHALIMTVTFVTVFIALHPFLYHQTLTRLPFMFTSRFEGELYYHTLYPATAVTSRVQALSLVVGKTLLPGGYGNFNVGGIPIDLLLFLTGVFLLGKAIYGSYRRTHKLADESILFPWAFVVLVSIVVYLRNDWPRYYLPSVMVVTLVEAYAITVFLRLFRKPLDVLISYVVNAFRRETQYL